MPDKVLALTIDDGPSDRVYELLELLREEQVLVTFFLVGKNLSERGDHEQLLARMRDAGHLVANHTYTHPSLLDVPSLAPAEILRTDALIAPYTTSGMFLFRAPYGVWEPELAPLLNGGASSKYVGPVHWDIDGRDWSCWTDEFMTPEDCAARYYEHIRWAGRGIILAHDHFAPVGRTIEMLRILLPQLIRDGYRFVRLDAVPNLNRRLREAGARPGPCIGC